jgi:hypothetical protein
MDHLRADGGSGSVVGTLTPTWLSNVRITGSTGTGSGTTGLGCQQFVDRLVDRDQLYMANLRRIGGGVNDGRCSGDHPRSVPSALASSTPTSRP